MPVVIALAAAVILGGVVVVAMGRGGELARHQIDLSSRTDFRTWSDVAEYRPPAALLGYHARATEHALSLIARALAERDAEIDWLRRRLAEVQSAGETHLGDNPESVGAGWVSGQAELAGPVARAADDETGDYKTADGGARDDGARDDRARDDDAAIRGPAMMVGPATGGPAGDRVAGDRVAGDAGASLTRPAEWEDAADEQAFSAGFPAQRTRGWRAGDAG